MICLTDVEPGAIVAPVFGGIAAESLAARTATLSVALTSLGENATSASVAWTLSGGPAAVASGTLDYPATGTASTGKKAFASFAFATPRVPVALGVPFAETDAAGTNATVTVKVERADRDATLALRAGGRIVQTWSGLAAGQTVEGRFPVGLGATKDYAFTLTHEDSATGERYEAAAEGTVLGRPAVGWLDVRFDRAGADNWTTASGIDGGTWTMTGGTNETAFADDGGDRRLEVDTGADGRVQYAASEASRPGFAVMVRGRAKLVSEPGAPEAPADAPLAGLALGDEGGGVRLYGWTADGWTALAGVPVAENEWIDWNATIDFTASPVTVTYGIGGVALSDAATGATALPVAGSPTSLRAVRYVGDGVVDDFRGVWYEPVAIVAIRAPEFAEAAPGGPLSFVVKDGRRVMQLVVSTADQPAGAEYAAFVCETLSPDDKDWIAVDDSRVASQGEIAAGAVSLDVPADARGRNRRGRGLSGRARRCAGPLREARRCGPSDRRRNETVGALIRA